MPSLFDRLEAVRRLRPRARLAAVAAALPHASEDEREPIAAELIELASGSPAAAAAALAAWDHLTSPARQTLLALAGADLPGLLARAEADHGRPALRTAADALAGPIDGSQRAALIGWLGGRPPADLAWTPDGRVALLAATTGAGGADAWEALDPALAAAAGTLETHHDPDVLAAVARAASRPGPRLRAWLAGADEADLIAIRSAIRDHAPDLPPAELVGLLGSTEFAAPVAAWLERGARRDDWSRLLESGHLLAVRERSRLVRRRPGVVSSMMTVADPLDAPRAAQRGAVRWLETATPTSARLDHLGRFVAAPDPLARLTAVRALANENPTPQRDQTLLEFALDEDARVASAAASLLDVPAAVAQTELGQRVMSLLTRSPHPAVRRHGARLGVRAALRRDRAASVRAILSLLQSGSPAQRTAALDLARRQRLASDVGRERLIATLMDTDARVAARAATLLGDLPPGGVAPALEHALHDDRRRVAANALESLVRLGHLVDLPALALDPTPRVRANALRAWLARDTAAGRQPLDAMLHDRRPGHRVSALWVAQRGAVTGVAPRVLEIRDNDPDPQVRARAERCARRLLAGMGGADSPMRRAS